MKLSLIILSLLFLASCQQYRYDITYEKCNSEITYNLVYTGSSAPFYSDRDRFIYINDGIRNICEFSYTKTPIK